MTSATVSQVLLDLGKNWTKHGCLIFVSFFYNDAGFVVFVVVELLHLSSMVVDNSFVFLQKESEQEVLDFVKVMLSKEDEVSFFEFSPLVTV